MARGLMAYLPRCRLNSRLVASFSCTTVAMVTTLYLLLGLRYQDPELPVTLPRVYMHAVPAHTHTDDKFVLSPGPEYCDTIKCTYGKPCTYPDEVNLRIIVLTYNRPSSLARSLNQLQHLDTLDHSMRLHVWVDRADSGQVHTETVRVANEFASKWRRGRACVHVHQRKASIIGQWVYTWRPLSDNSKEIGLILEDDVDVAPKVYPWLRAMKYHLGNRTDIMGYTLQSQNIQVFSGDQVKKPLSAPSEDNVFLYSVLGTWGFAPHPRVWRQFQDWFAGKYKGNATRFKPYVPGILPTKWYKEFEHEGKQSTMWEMWFIYFTHSHNLYCVYSNLYVFTRRRDIMLSFNRREKGLHFDGDEEPDSESAQKARWSMWNRGGASASDRDREYNKLLLKHWKWEYGGMSDAPPFYTYDATQTRRCVKGRNK